MKCFAMFALVLGSALLVQKEAGAASPHFIYCNATGVSATGTVTVSFKEAGLGANQNIDYKATATATATYVCVNRGGNIPQDPKKTTVTGPVTATGTFNSGKNGNIVASLTISPPPAPSTFTCPPGQTMRLANVTFSNVAVTDVTNKINCPTSPATFSRTFIVLP
jgi:hypothetical protein